MKDLDIKKKFQQLEIEISERVSEDRDITDLLKYKIKLLILAYKTFSNKIIEQNIKMDIPLYAQKIAYLNNIKEIQKQIKSNTTATDAEILKIQTNMRENGLGWILDNLPEKQV
jgi:hypothetical protein